MVGWRCYLLYAPECWTSIWPVRPRQICLYPLSSGPGGHFITHPPPRMFIRSGSDRKKTDRNMWPLRTAHRWERRKRSFCWRMPTTQTMLPRRGADCFFVVRNRLLHFRHVSRWPMRASPGGTPRMLPAGCGTTAQHRRGWTMTRRFVFR